MAKIAALAIPHKASAISDQVTISIGVSALQLDMSMSPKTLVLLADQALYKSKSCGKDQVQCIPPLK